MKEHNMTDNLLQKLEEKMMILLAELENLRKETVHLKQENQNLKIEYTNHMKKLQNLISLLDSIDTAHPPIVLHTSEFTEDELEYATA